MFVEGNTTTSVYNHVYLLKMFSNEFYTEKDILIPIFQCVQCSLRDEGGERKGLEENYYFHEVFLYLFLDTPILKILFLKV